MQLFFFLCGYIYYSIAIAPMLQDSLGKLVCSSHVKIDVLQSEEKLAKCVSRGRPTNSTVEAKP